MGNRASLTAAAPSAVPCPGTHPAYDLVVVEVAGDVITKKTYPVDTASGRFADAEHTSVNRTNEPLQHDLDAQGILATGTLTCDARGHLWLTHYEITITEITWSMDGGLNTPDRHFYHAKGEKTALALGTSTYIGGIIDAGKDTDISIEVRDHHAL